MAYNQQWGQGQGQGGFDPNAYAQQQQVRLHISWLACPLPQSSAVFGTCVASCAGRAPACL